MPTYEYLCKHCGHAFEELQSITEPPLVRCPNCGTDNLARVVGTGGGLIFKGSGFYLTDYKKAGKPQSDKPEAKKEEKKDSPDAKKPPSPPPSPPKKEK